MKLRGWKLLPDDMADDPERDPSEDSSITPSIPSDLTIPSALEPLLKDLSGEEKEEIASFLVSLSVRQRYSGPVPSSREMARYKDIDPELPRLMWESATNEQKHRHKMEELGLRESVESNHSGQRNALIFGLAAVIGATVIGVFGGPAGAKAAGVIGTVSVAVMGGVYVHERLRGRGKASKEGKGEEGE